MRLTNKFDLPKVVVDAVTADPYDAQGSDYTVTGLIAPARLRYLRKQHAEAVVEDVADNIFRLFGQAVHVLFERANTTGLAEERLFIQRGGLKISGQFDNLIVDTGILSDYKVTTVYAVKDGGREEWHHQLNILALIARENGFTINKLRVVAIVRDWSLGESKRYKDYPPSQVMVLEIPLWDEEHTENFLQERLGAHKEAVAKLPECSPEDRWQSPDIWAVFKDGGKRAKKTFISEAEAGSYCADLGAGHSVTFRPGQSKRCESFCPVSEFCEQWQKIKAAMPKTEVKEDGSKPE